MRVAEQIRNACHCAAFWEENAKKEKDCVWVEIWPSISVEISIWTWAEIWKQTSVATWRVQASVQPAPAVSLVASAPAPGALHSVSAENARLPEPLATDTYPVRHRAAGTQSSRGGVFPPASRNTRTSSGSDSAGLQ